MENVSNKILLVMFAWTNCLNSYKSDTKKNEKVKKMKLKANHQKQRSQKLKNCKESSYFATNKVKFP